MANRYSRGVRRDATPGYYDRLLQSADKEYDSEVALSRQRTAYRTAANESRYNAVTDAMSMALDGTLRTLEAKWRSDTEINRTMLAFEMYKAQEARDQLKLELEVQKQQFEVENLKRQRNLADLAIANEKRKTWIKEQAGAIAAELPVLVSELNGTLDPSLRHEILKKRRESWKDTIRAAQAGSEYSKDPDMGGLVLSDASLLPQLSSLEGDVSKLESEMSLSDSMLGRAYNLRQARYVIDNPDKVPDEVALSVVRALEDPAAAMYAGALLEGRQKLVDLLSEKRKSGGLSEPNAKAFDLMRASGGSSTVYSDVKKERDGGRSFTDAVDTVAQQNRLDLTKLSAQAPLVAAPSQVASATLGQFSELSDAQLANMSPIDEDASQALAVERKARSMAALVNSGKQTLKNAQGMAPEFEGVAGKDYKVRLEELVSRSAAPAQESAGKVATGSTKSTGLLPSFVPALQDKQDDIDRGGSKYGYQGSPWSTVGKEEAKTAQAAVTKGTQDAMVGLVKEILTTKGASGGVAAYDRLKKLAGGSDDPSVRQLVYDSTDLNKVAEAARSTIHAFYSRQFKGTDPRVSTVYAMMNDAGGLGAYVPDALRGKDPAEDPKAFAELADAALTSADKREIGNRKLRYTDDENQFGSVAGLVLHEKLRAIKGGAAPISTAEILRRYAAILTTGETRLSQTSAQAVASGVTAPAAQGLMPQPPK